MVICLEWGADLHMAQQMPLPLTVSCFSKIQIGLPFWYWLTRVVLDKGPLNGCVCVCVCVVSAIQWLVADACVVAVKGEYQCIIESVASTDSTFTISAVTGSIQVQATVLEAVGQYEISSTSINIPFIPAFHVITSELHVSGMHPHTMLKVSANDRVIQELQVIECFIVSRYRNLFSKSFYLDTRHLMQINYLLVSVLKRPFSTCVWLAVSLFPPHFPSCVCSRTKPLWINGTVFYLFDPGM